MSNLQLGKSKSLIGSLIVTLYNRFALSLCPKLVCVMRFYAGMWGSSLPAKVKITMWRIMNNYLPTYANLQARRLNVINCCPLCKREAENIEHIMRECVFVKELLETQRIPLTTQDADVPWKEWLALAFARLTPTWRHALMITYWTVWYARNKPWTSPGSARA
ncbi:hypothetical protein V6N12_042585 [Hibiscus sabdariffa]|uniref:Reverse transcriptase zinc-binding domain-containing protein n=1 Tax=Hibiscus sabdariffa TaxID=183260 RepID=A0ABR2EF82_9ROSI